MVAGTRDSRAILGVPSMVGSITQSTLSLRGSFLKNFHD